MTCHVPQWIPTFILYFVLYKSLLSWHLIFFILHLYKDLWKKQSIYFQLSNHWLLGWWVLFFFSDVSFHYQSQGWTPSCLPSTLTTVTWTAQWHEEGHLCPTCWRSPPRASAACWRNPPRGLALCYERSALLQLLCLASPQRRTGLRTRCPSCLEAPLLVGLVIMENSSWHLNLPFGFSLSFFWMFNCIIISALHL